MCKDLNETIVIFVSLLQLYTIKIKIENNMMIVLLLLFCIC